MASSKFTSQLTMDNARIERSLLMSDRAQFNKVDLSNAQINGHLDMTSSKFTNTLNLNSIQINRSLLMRDGATFNEETILRGSTIRNQVDLAGSLFKDVLWMDSIKVHGHLVMSKIMNNSEFATVVLNDAKVDGTLILENSNFIKSAKLILRNTKVNTIQDTSNAWPMVLELDGFTYESLGGVLSDSINDLNKRDLSWFKEWLRKQNKFSPQPYEQLAKVLREVGRGEDAREILYDCKAREYHETTDAFSRIWLTFLKIFIGYGYRIYYALYWAIFLVLLGMFSLKLSKQDRVHGLRYFGLAYSIDMILPIIELRKYHYDSIELEGWVRVYFYFHKLLGYVIALFIIGGLSGLLK